MGFALSLPDKRVVVLDGDGSLLMNLGSLVTIASAKPRNLFHFVSQNGTYEANGGHPIPARDTIDFAAVARSVGYLHAFIFKDLQTLRDQIGGLLDLDGPVMVALHVAPGKPVTRDYAKLYDPQKREEFRREIAALRGA